MFNSLGVRLEELNQIAEIRNPVSISSMGRIFAELEVAALIGKGTSRENLVHGTLDSVIKKEGQLSRKISRDTFFKPEDYVIMSTWSENQEFMIEWKF